MIEFEDLAKKALELKSDVERMLTNFEIDELIRLEPERENIIGKFAQLKYTSEISAIDLYRLYFHALDQDLIGVEVEKLTDQNFRTLWQMTH